MRAYLRERPLARGAPFQRLAAGRLHRRRPAPDRRDVQLQRLVGLQRDGVAVVLDVERLAVDERVSGVAVGDLHPQAAAEKPQTELQAGERRRQPRPKAEPGYPDAP